MESNKKRVSLTTKATRKEKKYIVDRIIGKLENGEHNLSSVPPHSRLEMYLPAYCGVVASYVEQANLEGPTAYMKQVNPRFNDNILCTRFF
jgi:hypothetical protein